MSESKDSADRPDDSADDEGFLQRWSRRKHQAKQAEQSAPEIEAETDADAEINSAERKVEQPTAPEAAAEVEPEPPGDDDMPPLESIDQGGSVGDFFSPKVSAGLRKAALRRLFSQPEFNAPEVLEEYAGDYSKPALLGNIVTADMRFRAEQAKKLAERKIKEALEKKTRPEAHSEEGLSLASEDSVAPPASEQKQESEPAAEGEEIKSVDQLAENTRPADESSDQADPASPSDPKPSKS